MKFTKQSKSTAPAAATAAPAPAARPFERFGPTIPKSQPVPASATLTPEEQALFEKFKAMAEAEKHPVSRKPVFEKPAPPTAKTERMNALLAEMDNDDAPYIRSARAWKLILDDGLWEDAHDSFKSVCQRRALNPNWVTEWIGNLEIFDGLSPANQKTIRSQDDLSALSRFRKSDRNQIVAHAAARNRLNSQFATRITDSARALGLKEAKS